jgi:hypothetical protein
MKAFHLIMLVLVPMAVSLQHVEAISDQNDQVMQNTWMTSVNKQIQLVADVTNKQDTTLPFVYIIQVKDSQDKAVSLTWITGSLQPHQSMSPAQSWIPTKAGVYTAQIFVWESIEGGPAWSEPLEMKIIAT